MHRALAPATRQRGERHLQSLPICGDGFRLSGVLVEHGRGDCLASLMCLNELLYEGDAPLARLECVHVRLEEIEQINVHNSWQCAGRIFFGS